MKFGLFLLLNAILLIRPEELFQELAGLRLYLIVISLCTLVTLPELMETLSLDSLRRRPISACVLLYFVSTILSLCILGRFEEALLDFGPEFGKVILYYLLLVSVIDGPSRLRFFILFLIFVIVILTAIALAQQFGFASFPSIVPCLQTETDPVTGEQYTLLRMCSSGLFSDPNDLCLILGLGIVSCLYYAAAQDTPILLRLGVLLPIPVFVLALTETHSRGGLLGVLAGACTFLVVRFGGPKLIPVVAVSAVVALGAIGGRQGNIAGGGTAHERLMMWADGFFNLFHRPLYLPTGLGIGWYVDECGLVAHNSFVQAYVEQGIFGGGTFLAAFILSAWIPYRFGKTIPASHWACDMRPYACAVACGYAMGCYSLTRNMVLPTYLTLGIVASVIESTGVALPAYFYLSRRWFMYLIAFAVAGLVFLKFATQLLGMAGI